MIATDKTVTAVEWVAAVLARRQDKGWIGGGEKVAEQCARRRPATEGRKRINLGKLHVTSHT
jgi:hypothetical protein